ncbi:ABC transporter ATP-binding protein [Nonomuraea sp. CA-141351]|uniref:ABC transporter ATP-binding protein n=1 Tax=Nonomuraea sp. CA-141351 TaxID=3239996 RepID=UPI003D8E255B
MLTVDELHVRYGRRTVVDGISLNLSPGETLGLVGESGSGKSTIGNAILGLVRATSGKIVYNGEDVTHAKPRVRRRLSRHIQVVFQDPYGSLNPARTIGQTLTEHLRFVQKRDRGQATARVSEVLADVGLPAEAAERYPSAFSGGQRQRIAIARALIPEPRLIVCDEPTSALDLSVQAHILNLLLDLRERLGLGYLFISHDLDVVRHMSHRIAVLHRGRIVEQGPAAQVSDHPAHPYTRTLWRQPCTSPAEPSSPALP